MTSANAPKYSDTTKQIVLSLLKVLRDRVVIPNGAIKGIRFSDDSDVLAILQSQCTEEVFVEDPVFEVTRALVEAARTDYWYSFEKGYELDEYEDENFDVEE